MSTKNAKATTSKKDSIVNINLSMFSKKLENKNLEEKKTRESIYNYPEHLNTEEKRNSKEGKKFRSNLRRNLERICTNILLHTKYARTEDLKNSIIEFKAFYVKNYRVNDLTVNSVSQSAKEERLDDLKMMFEIIQHVELSSKKEKTPKVKKEVSVVSEEKTEA